MEKDLIKIFASLTQLLEKHKKDLEAHETTIGSKARGNKPALHLYGKKKVSIVGRKPQQTYVVGIILQKNFVGFYSMPIYSHPKEFKIDNPDLIKFRKGKSCINVHYLNKQILQDIEQIIKQGIKVYKREGWI